MPTSGVCHVSSILPGHAALVSRMHCYLSGAMSNDVNLLEVHTLMYFMQEAGEPLKLHYEQGVYGPYADDLRHVLHAVEGRLLSGCDEEGDDATRSLHILPGAYAQANAVLQEHVDTHERFERVLDLVSGFESFFALELLASVHWVATRSDATDVHDVVRGTWEWGARKRQFKEWQIELVYDTLREKGWLERPAVAA